MSDRLRRDERAVRGRVAIIHAQLAVAILLLIAQIWLITISLNSLLSGRPRTTGVMAGFSALAFAINFGMMMASRRRQG